MEYAMTENLWEMPFGNIWDGHVFLVLNVPMFFVFVGVPEMCWDGICIARTGIIDYMLAN